MPEVSISFSWAPLARKKPLRGAGPVPTMESATWCRTPAAASAARRLRPEVSKNSNTALASNEGELARSITTCVPAMAPLRPSPVMVLTPVLGEAATTSWPPWRRMATVLEPIRQVPPITTIFIANLLVRSPHAGVCDGCATSRRSERTDKPSSVTSPPHEPLHALVGVDLGIQPSTTPSRRRGAEVEEDVPPSQLGIGKRFVRIPPPRDGHGSPTIAAWFGGARLVRRGHAHARDTSHASAAVNECVYANHRPDGSRRTVRPPCVDHLETCLVRSYRKPCRCSSLSP